MLNAKKLSELLAHNVNPRLYPRIFVMSPNGTLLAYSTPANIKDLRDQAALISMAWKEQETALRSRSKGTSALSSGSSSVPEGCLETLTIEFDSNNLIIRAIQPNMLLVLVGGAPPGRTKAFTATPEIRGGLRYPPSEYAPSLKSSSPPTEHGSQPDSTVGADSLSNTNSEVSIKDQDVKLGLLHIQRKKLDTLARFIQEDLDSKGFVMPDDSAFH